MRLRVLLILLLVGVALGATAEDEFACLIEAGYGGQLPPAGGVVPVSVTITNRARSATGRIRITQQVGSHEVAVETPFTSPAPSSKRFTVLVRVPSGSAGLRVTVDGGPGIAPTAKEFSTVGRDERAMLLTVGLPVPYVQALTTTETDNPMAKVYQVTKLAPGDLPDEALAYDSAQIVGLSLRSLTRLAPEQLQALRDWVAVGGRLLLVGKDRDREIVAAATALGLAADWLDAPGVHHCHAGWVAVDGDDGTPLWTPGAQNAAVSAFFPALRQVSDEKLFGISSHGLDNGIFPDLTRKQGTYGWRGFFWLALIILLYLAVIGPLDWWLVKRLGKPQLTWAFFGGAIVIFSAVAYWYSGLVHAGNMQAVYLNVLDASVDGRVARGNSLFWIYSTRNTQYQLRLGSGAPPAVVFGARESTLGAGSAAAVTITASTPPTVDAKIPIFSAKYFDATWLQPWTTPVQVSAPGRPLQVTLPPSLVAASVELADASGLQALAYDATAKAWVASGAPQPWANVFAPFGRGNEYIDSNYFQRGDTDDLPPTAKVVDLARWLSFGYVDPKLAVVDESVLLKKSNSAQPIIFSGAKSADVKQLLDLLHARDAREEALNIRPRVEHGGRVLFITLAPGHSLLPLTLNITPPQSLAVDVLRVQLP